MKKILLLLLLSSLVISTTSCTLKPTGTPGSDPVTPAPPIVSDIPSSVPSSDKDSSSTFEKVHVADAAMYRGTVMEIKENDGGKTLVLEQAKGTDFGSPTLTFVTTDDTRLSFEADKLVKGVYLEVYYGQAPGQKLDATKENNAIGINLYPSSEMVVFNGTIKVVEPNPDKEGEGQITMSNLDREEEVVFNYSQDNTQFYLTFEDLKVGDKLNIFHSGAYTRSIPPQGSAIEVRMFTE